MSIAQSLLPEFEMEMATTRKLLERVPGDKGAWKPHPKSFSLEHLAQLVATMPGWTTNMLTATELDLAAAPGYNLEPTATLLGKFDQGVRGARDALAAARDADFEVPWSLKHGPRVLFTAPRMAVVRQHINHMVHHRGQLSVYLRLNDVPLPSMYGPPRPMSRGDRDRPRRGTTRSERGSAWTGSGRRNGVSSNDYEVSLTDTHCNGGDHEVPVPDLR